MSAETYALGPWNYDGGPCFEIVAPSDHITEHGYPCGQLIVYVPLSRDLNDGRDGLPPRTESEAEKIANFIAEAGTVAHETGMTPRQLADKLRKGDKLYYELSEIARLNELKVFELEKENQALTFQRNELLEALEQCAEALAFAREKLGLCGDGDGQGRKNNSDDDTGSLAALTAARTAISKATVGAL